MSTNTSPHRYGSIRKQIFDKAQCNPYNISTTQIISKLEELGIPVQQHKNEHNAFFNGEERKLLFARSSEASYCLEKGDC